MVAAPGAGLAVDLVEIVAGRIVVLAGRARGRRHADARECGRCGPSSQTQSMRRDHGRAAPARRRACAAPRAAPRRRSAGGNNSRLRPADDGSARRGTRPRARALPAARPRRASWSPCSRPVAASGSVGSAVESPISASGPRRRTNGKLSPRVAAHVVAPVALREVRGRAHIGVVIARHQRDVARRAEPFEPGARRREFVAAATG